MKLTGQKLKEKREEARLTISEVSLATKINPKVISAMESGDLGTLPAKTFLRGFVRSYASFLKMNVSEVMVLFNQEIEPAPTQSTPPPPEPAVPTRVDVNGDGSNTIRMIVIAGILLLIVMIIFVKSLIQKYEREKVTASTEATLPAAVEATPSHEPSATHATEPVVAATQAAIAASPEPKPEESPKAVEAKPIAVVPSPSPSPSAKPAPPAALAQTEPKPEEKAEEPKPAETSSSEKKHMHHEIILEALDKVEVRFHLHGEEKKIAMAPNEVHTIIADEPITLEVSDGGALNITDNGRDKGPAGDLGHPQKVSIP